MAQVHGGHTETLFKTCIQMYTVDTIYILQPLALYCCHFLIEIFVGESSQCFGIVWLSCIPAS